MAGDMFFIVFPPNTEHQALHTVKYLINISYITIAYDLSPVLHTKAIIDVKGTLLPPNKLIICLVDKTSLGNSVK